MGEFGSEWAVSLIGHFARLVLDQRVACRTVSSRIVEDIAISKQIRQIRPTPGGVGWAKYWVKQAVELTNLTGLGRFIWDFWSFDLDWLPPSLLERVEPDGLGRGADVERDDLEEQARGAGLLIYTASPEVGVDIGGPDGW